MRVRMQSKVKGDGFKDAEGQSYLNVRNKELKNFFSFKIHCLRELRTGGLRTIHS